MKKLVAVLCAAVMTVGMAVNVFAAPSPSVSGVVTKVVSAVDADGNDAEIVLETVSDAEARSHFTEAEKNAVDDMLANWETIAKSVLGDKFVDGMQLVDIKNLYVSEGAVVKFPLTITVAVTGVTKDSTVAVLHYKESTNAWEDVNAVAGDGTITFTVDSLSPFAFFVDAKTAESTGSNVNGSNSGSTVSGGSNTSTTSPATGEANTMVWVAIVAVAAAAGMVVTYRKKRA